MIERTYTVTYSCDYLDSNPVIKTFDDYYEMQDWISEEVQARLDFFVQHSPYTISEEDLKNQEEIEYSLMTIKEL
jgi:archaellum component FlaD/FlaE